MTDDPKQPKALENPQDDDELDDPIESFKRGWDDAMNGRVMTHKEFVRRMSEDDDEAH